MRSTVAIFAFLLAAFPSRAQYVRVVETTPVFSAGVSSYSFDGIPLAVEPGDTLKVSGQPQGEMRIAQGIRQGGEIWTGRVSGKALAVIPNDSIPAGWLIERAAELRLRADDAFYASTPDIVLYRLSASSPYGSPEVSLRWGMHNPEKTIKYIRFWMRPYNAVGDPLTDRFGKREMELYATGPFRAQREPHYSGWEHVWFDINATCMKVNKVRVEYTDGTRYTYIRELPSILAEGFSNSCTLEAQERSDRQ